jgi:hypothetical protein
MESWNWVQSTVDRSRGTPYFVPNEGKVFRISRERQQLDDLGKYRRHTLKDGDVKLDKYDAWVPVLR